MSNNAPDYKDNLAFPPEENCYEASLEKKLKTAEKALEFIVKTIPSDKWIGEKDLEDCYNEAEKALATIKK